MMDSYPYHDATVCYRNSLSTTRSLEVSSQSETPPMYMGWSKMQATKLLPHLRQSEY